MERKSVTSSNIVSVGHDAEGQILEVEFKNGVYRYFEVSPEAHQAFVSAESLGRHFQEHIRGKYRFEKLGPQAAA
jgi:frataxin-like iron-binding protein CyaY